MASGTTAEVIENAGLVTFRIEGGRIDHAERLLRESDEVDQVAPFGATLHAVGHDAERLEQAVREVAKATGSRATPAETSLEDAFIRFIGAAERH